LTRASFFAAIEKDRRVEPGEGEGLGRHVVIVDA
jgi:hypothetical protein